MLRLISYGNWFVIKAIYDIFTFMRGISAAQKGLCYMVSFHSPKAVLLPHDLISDSVHCVGEFNKLEQFDECEFQFQSIG